MALINKLENIAAAIREKTGKSDLLTLEEMATEISEIETGSGSAELPEEAFKITGDCSYRFSQGGWDWFIENYGDKIITEAVSNMGNMFQYSEVEEIPFDVNIRNDCKTISYTFTGCSKLTKLPLIKGELAVPTGNYSGVLNLNDIFSNCRFLRTVPNDYFSNFGGDAFWEASKQYRGNRKAIFDGCYSLRQLPNLSLLKITDTSSYSVLYYNMCNYCYVLDEIIDLPVYESSVFTSNAFSNTFNSCHRLKDMTFETNEDGTPIVVQWKNQAINFYPSSTNTVGYGGCGFSDGVVSPSSNVLKYNSGITADKAVYNDATYQALKDEPDWFAMGAPYSRYNHDSAVNTINSLPDTSAYLAANGGTNTIKFFGMAGSATDGGAINTLTEEEIAVAAAKGWTITLV